MPEAARTFGSPTPAGWPPAGAFECPIHLCRGAMTPRRFFLGRAFPPAFF